MQRLKRTSPQSETRRVVVQKPLVASVLADFGGPPGIIAVPLADGSLHESSRGCRLHSPRQDFGLHLPGQQAEALHGAHLAALAFLRWFHCGVEIVFSVLGERKRGLRMRHMFV